MITEYWINKVFDEKIKHVKKENAIIGIVVAEFLEDLKQKILKGGEGNIEKSNNE